MKTKPMIMLAAVLALSAISCYETDSDVKSPEPETAESSESETAGAAKSETARGFYGFTVKDIDGNEVKLEKFKGKLLLVVNVASKCGYTPQYEGLQKIYEKYKDKGFLVLGFPANNFMRQEPGSNAEIKQFCKLNFGVTFPMFSKISVKGSKIDPLYKYLTSGEANADVSGNIKWNFTKFLVDKNGNVISRFGSGVKPESEEITAAIENAL